MTDSSTFRDAVESAVEPVVEQPVAAQETQQEVVEESTPKVEQTPEVETFAETPDQKELEAMTPQQLLEIKKNWEKAYTQKRQKEVQQLREYEERIKQFESSQSQPIQNGTVEERAEQAQQELNLGTMSLEEYSAYMQQLSREAAREEFQQMAREQKEEALAQSSLEQFQSADSRLSEHSPEYDERFAIEVRREIADLLDEHLNQNGTYEGFNTQEITKEIVERRDREIDEIIKKRTLQSTQAAKMREAKFRKNEVRGTTSESQQLGGDSIRSILSEAIDG